MRFMMRALLVVAASGLLLGAVPAGADDAGAQVKIKKWKVDVVDLYPQPGGKGTVVQRPAAELADVKEAQRVGDGWLKIQVQNTDYYVEASQVRTDLKLSGKPKCEKLDSTGGFAASRGYGEDGCEP